MSSEACICKFCKHGTNLNTLKLQIQTYSSVWHHPSCNTYLPSCHPITHRQFHYLHFHSGPNLCTLRCLTSTKLPAGRARQPAEEPVQAVGGGGRLLHVILPGVQLRRHHRHLWRAGRVRHHHCRRCASPSLTCFILIPSSEMIVTEGVCLP